jgi:hypothetical protein
LFAVVFPIFLSPVQCQNVHFDSCPSCKLNLLAVLCSTSHTNEVKLFTTIPGETGCCLLALFAMPNYDLFANSITLSTRMTNNHLVVLYISTRQRDACANTPPPGSRGLDVVLACVEEGAILIEGVVLASGVSSRVGVATCAHKNVPLSGSCRYETVPSVLRNVLVRHVAGKTVRGRFSRRMRTTGEEEAEPTRLLGACRHAKTWTGVARVHFRLSPWERLTPR